MRLDTGEVQPRAARRRHVRHERITTHIATLSAHAADQSRRRDLLHRPESRRRGHTAMSGSRKQCASAASSIRSTSRTLRTAYPVACLRRVSMAVLACGTTAIHFTQCHDRRNGVLARPQDVSTLLRRTESKKQDVSYPSFESCPLHRRDSLYRVRISAGSVPSIS